MNVFKLGSNKDRKSSTRFVCIDEDRSETTKDSRTVFTQNFKFIKNTILESPNLQSNKSEPKQGNRESEGQCLTADQSPNNWNLSGIETEQGGVRKLSQLDESSFFEASIASEPLNKEPQSGESSVAPVNKLVRVTCSKITKPLGVQDYPSSAWTIRTIKGSVTKSMPQFNLFQTLGSVQSIASKLQAQDSIEDGLEESSQNGIDTIIDYAQLYQQNQDLQEFILKKSTTELLKQPKVGSGNLQCGLTYARTVPKQLSGMQK